MDLDTPQKIDYKLLSVGDILVDEFLKIPESGGKVEFQLDHSNRMISFPYGEKILAEDVDYAVGGNAANNAVGMSRMGIKTVLLSTIGDDWTTKVILDTMAKEGVGTFLMTTQGGVSGARGVVINYRGERTLFGFHPGFLYKPPKDLAKVEWVYLTSMGEGYEETYQRIIGWKKESGGKLAFNPGTRQILDGKGRWEEVLAATDILFVNKEEAETIVGMGGEGASDDRSVIENLLGELAKLGPKMVVVTDGPKGAYVTEKGKSLWSSIYDVPVVETTGAGDGFGTGFLAAIVDGKGIEEALKWGMIQSASVISKVGAQAGLLSRRELEEWLSKGGGVRVEEI